MFKRTTVLLFLIFGSLVCGFTQTDSTYRGSDLFNLSLEELMNINVFTASKKNEKVSDAPAIMSVITRKDIEKMGVTSLVDVLKYVPGIETSMGADGIFRISMRGTRKDGNILMLLNGQSMNDFYSGKAIYDLPIGFIEKIEIVRGPGSALYGSNAVAGVINIFTTKNNDATIHLGNNNTYSGNINYYLKKKETSLSISGGYNYSDGANAIIESDAAEQQTWSLTYDSLYFKTKRWNRDVFLNTNLTSGNFKLNLFELNRNQGAWIGPLLIAAPGSKLQTNQTSGNISYDYKINDAITLIPKVYGNMINHNFHNKEAPDNYKSLTSGNIFTNGKQTDEKYTSLSWGSELAINIQINRSFTILTGNVIEFMSLPFYNVKRNYKIVGDIYMDELGNYDNILLTQKNKSRYVFAYYLQGDYKWKNLNITTGLRYDNYSDFGQSFNPRIGINYNVSKRFRLKVLYGKAFRAPTFQELYDNTTIGNEYGIKGNENLKPENIQTLELGTELNYIKSILRYNIFYIINTNLIRVYDPHGGGSIGVYENIGNITTYGQEAEAIIILNPKINFIANFSQFVSYFEWKEGNVRQADVIFLKKQPQCDKQLTNIPTIRLNTGFSFTFYKFNTFVGINYGSKAENNKRFYLEADKVVEIPSYLLANFNITYNIKSKFKIRLAANNIGKKFSDPDETTNIDKLGQKGMAQPTESFLVGLTYKF